MYDEKYMFGSLCLVYVNTIGHRHAENDSTGLVCILLRVHARTPLPTVRLRTSLIFL
jgi:hypothetical protein